MKAIHNAYNKIPDRPASVCHSTLEQRKSQTLMGESIVYLKLEGVDPKTHPVVGELVRSYVTLYLKIVLMKLQGRIKEYFDKIEKTENPPQRMSPGSPHLSLRN